MAALDDPAVSFIVLAIVHDHFLYHHNVSRRTGMLLSLPLFQHAIVSITGSYVPVPVPVSFLFPVPVGERVFCNVWV